MFLTWLDLDWIVSVSVGRLFVCVFVNDLWDLVAFGFVPRIFGRGCCSLLGWPMGCATLREDLFGFCWRL